MSCNYDDDDDNDDDDDGCVFKYEMICFLVKTNYSLSSNNGLMW